MKTINKRTPKKVCLASKYRGKPTSASARALFVLFVLLALLAGLSGCFTGKGTNAQDLRLSIKGPVSIDVLKETEYTITVTNEKNHSVKNVQVLYVVPSTVKYTDSTPAGLFRMATATEPAQVTWQLDEIQPHADVTIKLRGQCIKGGRCRHIVKLADANDGDNFFTDAGIELNILIGPAVHISLLATTNPCEVGQESTYVLKAERNRYADTPVTDLTVSCNVPEQLEFVGTSGNVPFKFENGEVVFAPLPTLAPGKKSEYKITCKALRPYSAKFTVVVKYNELDQAISLESKILIYK